MQNNNLYFRKAQTVAALIISLPLFDAAGVLVTGLSDTLSTVILSPAGAVVAHTEATFTEPASDGIYVCTFALAAPVPAFTLVDQNAAYTLTLSSSAITIEIPSGDATPGVVPTVIDLWIVSKFPWEVVVAFPVMEYNLYSVTAQPQKELRLVRGDTHRLYFDLNADFTSWTAYFAVKERIDDMLYLVEPKVCQWTDIAAGEGYIDLTSADTAKAVNQAVAEIRVECGTEQYTAAQFYITIVRDVMS